MFFPRQVFWRANQFANHYSEIRPATVLNLEIPPLISPSVSIRLKCWLSSTISGIDRRDKKGLYLNTSSTDTDLITMMLASSSSSPEQATELGWANQLTLVPVSRGRMRWICIRVVCHNNIFIITPGSNHWHKHIVCIILLGMIWMEFIEACLSYLHGIIISSSVWFSCWHIHKNTFIHGFEYV